MAGEPPQVSPDGAGEEPALADGERRVRLDVSYDGTGFAGWARQEGQRTVQGVLTEGLEKVLRTPIALTVAGRTDAGVHATGQVAHVDLPEPLWEALAPTLLRRVNGVLPSDLRVRQITSVSRAFDARFSAVSRRYCYRITDDPWGAEPLERWRTLAWPRRLDWGAVKAASLGLLGEHDFAAYCRRREGATTIRRLLELSWDLDDQGIHRAWVRADAFCHSMVRSLIGALLAVGEGRRPAMWPAELLARRERAGDVTVAPARGLTLVLVEYPPEEQWGARSALTRRLRRPME
jgi:tRNA pseudouridine38-40 synthase